MLDEISVANSHAVAEAVYALANGAGKGRLARNASMQEPRDFRVMLFSTGEVSIATKIAELEGRKHRAGQSVRLLDIPADRGRGFGVFDNPGGFADPGMLSDAIKLAATEAYGTSGPALVTGLVGAGVDTVASWARKGIDKFVRKHTPPGSGDQVGRVARKLGLIAVAGELAIQFGIVPWAKDEAWAAAAEALDAWINTRGGTGSHEDAQAIRQVRHCIEQYGDARFEPLGSPPPLLGQAGQGLTNIEPRPIANRLGFRVGEGATRRWYVLPEAWKNDVCGGLDTIAAARALAKNGMLLPSASGQVFSRSVRIAGQKVRVYILTSAVLA